MAESRKPPVAIVCVGMAGSGKTTFMQRINSYLYSTKEAPYVINLDPAVRTVPFDSNIDIRDSVNYKEVMKQYNLGPNGGILTSLNLFATKIDQILELLEKRTGVTGYGSKQEAPAEPTPEQRRIQHILVDTPGQIEVFVWSASGDILLSSLASTFPTVIAYIIDTPRTASTSTFMSNMLYACSILYKTRLPMILVFNKTDVRDAEFAKEWMTDFEAFQAALKEEQEQGTFGSTEGSEAGGYAQGSSGYMGSLLNSMSLVFEEFYRHLSVVGVSSMTGQGVEDFFEAVAQKAEEFERDYKPELQNQHALREKAKQDRRDRELGRMMSDMNMEGSGTTSKKSRTGRKEDAETISDLEDEEENAEQMGEPAERIGDPDDYDSEDMDEGNDDEGLSTRYKRALEDHNPTQEDLSFARYVQRASMG
ncbi:ATPase NPA3 [Patellaria atrata CBS 101060]|uniref:GPN-loop GTPase n=1 Tax=Patellaria atrata CBS 101060 TaxID=1346257 RepID=A0A9P4SGG1_9PEZI|nr:ATPase NPA3 [Patellaria atrata CBS 101060]